MSFVDLGRVGYAQRSLLLNANSQKLEDFAGIAFHAGETFQKAISLCLSASEREDLANEQDLIVQEEVHNLLQGTRF